MDSYTLSDISNYQNDFRYLTELKYSILRYRIASVDGTNNTKGMLKKYGTASSSQGISDYLPNGYTNTRRHPTLATKTQGE